MADKQISELTKASALTGEELLVISQNGEARQVTARKLAALGGGSSDGITTAGGYYTPVVTQPTTDTMQVGYTPSDTSMPEVPAVTVNLPAGKTPVKGTDYWTEADKQEMVEELTEQAAPVSYNAQTLTEEQKAQARANIGATSNNVLMSLLIPILKSGLYESDQSANILALEQLLTPALIVPATSITVSCNQLNFVSDAPQSLTATVMPENTTDVVIWTSSDENVASVVNGVVTPIHNGDCIITAKAGEYTASCVVTVLIGGSVISENLDIAVGAISVHSSGERIAYYAASPTRACINPLCVYITPGKTYTISLADYTDYFFAVFGLKTSKTDIDFGYANGTTTTFWADFETTIDSGWLYQDYEYIADETTNLLCVQFSRKDSMEMTDEDIAKLKTLLMMTEV